MLYRLVFLWGLVVPGISMAQSIEDEDYRPWVLQFAMASRDKNLFSLHALTETSQRGKVGISYSRGEDALSVFHEPLVSTGRGYGRYASDRLRYQMFALQYQYALPAQIWAALSLGRLEIHETKSLSNTSTCSYCDVYLNSTNGPAMDIDISKSYGSFSMGWTAEILPHVSLGFIAFEYIFKGDSSGIHVNSLNGILFEERARLHAALSEYARRDYFQPPRLMIQFDF